MSYVGPESTSTKGGAAMSHKDKAATAIMINQQQRISELESVLREALNANQFNSHGWVHKAIKLLESQR